MTTIDITTKDPALSEIEPLIVLNHQDAETLRQCTYYIIGTAHVSSRSVEDVKKLVSTVKPKLVFVELCHERQSMLHLDKETLMKPPTLSETFLEIRLGKATPFQAIYSWLLAKVGSGLECAPGEEFRVAVQEAKEVGAAVVLGDRPLGITIARVWRSLSLWEKWKLSFSLLWTGFTLDNDELDKELERMKGSDVLTEAIREFGKEFPSMIGPLLYERDQFMVHMLRQLSSRGDSVVAVVGAGHLEGIQSRWDEEIDIDAICMIPEQPKSRHSFSIGWSRLAILAAVTGVAIVAVARYRRH